MMPDEIRRVVRRIIATVTESDEAAVTGTAHLIDELGIDSTMAMEIIFMIEEELAIEIYAEEFVGVENLDQAVALIEKLLPSAGDAHGT